MQETQETQVRSLGWEDPQEEGLATYSSILAWEIPLTEEPGCTTVHRVTKSQTRLKHAGSRDTVIYALTLLPAPCPSLLLEKISRPQHREGLPKQISETSLS